MINDGGHEEAGGEVVVEMTEREPFSLQAAASTSGTTSFLPDCIPHFDSSGSMTSIVVFDQSKKETKDEDDDDDDDDAPAVIPLSQKQRTLTLPPHEERVPPTTTTTTTGTTTTGQFPSGSSLAPNTATQE